MHVLSWTRVKSSLKLGRLRRIFQTVSFSISNLGFTFALKTGFIYPFLYCYGCPLAAFGCPIGTLQSFAAIPACPFFLIGSVGVYGTIFGRAYCGWACPFGAFHDLLAYLKGSKKRKLRPLSYSKFAMLFLVILVAWAAADTVFCKYCPAGSLFAAIPSGVLSVIPSAVAFHGLKFGLYFYVHIGTLILTVVLGLAFSRFWCRYLCPMGSIGIFNKASLVTISLDPTACTKCEACLKVCPMNIEKVEDIGNSSDCTLCGRCVEVCKTNALKISLRRR